MNRIGIMKITPRLDQSNKLRLFFFQNKYIM